MKDVFYVPNSLAEGGLTLEEVGVMTSLFSYNEKGVCKPPNLKSYAEMFKMSKTTLLKILKSLEEKGYLLTRHRRVGGKQASNIYFIKFRKEYLGRNKKGLAEPTEDSAFSCGGGIPKIWPIPPEREEV